MSEEAHSELRELRYPNSKGGKVISIPYTTITLPHQDFTDYISKENFNLMGNIFKESWTSNLLDQSGHYLHKWQIHTNTRRAPYQDLKIESRIAEDGGPIQFIPESLEVLKLVNIL